jgi:hypothetical protein
MTVGATRFKREIEALRLGGSIALHVRYGTDLAHCIEASHAAAVVLRKRGIEATAEPCSVYIDTTTGIGASIGHTQESLYSFLCANSSGEPPPYEEWSKTHANFTKERFPLHFVVRAKNGTASALLDLTIGQISALIQQEGFPSSMAIFGEPNKSGFLEVETARGDRIVYGPCPHEEAVAEYKDPSRVCMDGIVGDMSDLADLALEADLDRDRFVKLVGERMRSPG